MTRRSWFLWTVAAASARAASGADRRAAFLRLIDRPRVPLDASISSVSKGERVHFSFASERSQRVPGILVRPRSAAGKRLPVVVALHGTGGTKESQLPLLERLAGLGFLAVAIDGRYHGARTRAGKGSSEYVDAILRAYRGSGEHPFLYDTVWDLMRLVDWLTGQPDVDAGRIGMIGFSKGGMELYLAAAADPRIAAAVPCIGVQSFRWAIENNAWQSRVGTFQAAVDAAAREDADGGRLDGAFLKRFYDRVAPGVYGEFDGPQMLPLIAPRPLLVINGDSDARTPMAGLRECLGAAERAYRDAGAADGYRVLIEPNTGHKVNPDAMDAAMQWFSQRLG